MLERIEFSGYKAFRDLTNLEIRPVTLIIGKNSSGKSSVLKLFPLLEQMLSGRLNYPLILSPKGISLGAEYNDLFYNQVTSDLMINLHYTNEVKIETSYFNNVKDIGISHYSIKNGEHIAERRLEDDKSAIKGLIDEELINLVGIDANDLKISVNYIGPYRIPAPHSIIFKGLDNMLTVGYDGSGAYDLLLNSYRSDKELLKQISEWMKNCLEGQYLEFNNISNSSGTYNLFVKRNLNPTNISGVGQGIAQVLPIITQSFIAEPHSINVIEQPALHLHPAAHANVAYRLGLSAKERRCRYVIESHSENILLGFRHMIVNPDVDFGPEDIVVYFVDNDRETAMLKEITIDSEGELSDWPTGVFGEGFELLREINQMRSR